jgi:hypothetical protein
MYLRALWERITSGNDDGCYKGESVIQKWPIFRPGGLPVLLQLRQQCGLPHLLRRGHALGRGDFKQR